MEGLNLRELFLILRKRAWIIILITVLSITVTGFVSYFLLQPVYETFTTLMVGKPKNYNDEIQYQDVLLNQKLVATYGEIVKSCVVLNEVIEKLDLKISSKELSEKINVSSVGDTEIIKIQVFDTNPELATNIANELASVLIKHITRLMKIENVQVIDKAEIPTISVKPRPKFNMAVAGSLSIMISAFIILILEYLDNTINTPDELESYLNLPVLGMIPKNKHSINGGLK